jgi:hypothetical protein
MKLDGKSLISQCRAQGIDIYRYGADLPEMANVELKTNIWAVRFLYWHIFHRGLCLRPPWSMVDHIGFDPLATNASDGRKWSNPPLKRCPPIPIEWPAPIENLECSILWQKAYGGRPTLFKQLHRLTRRVRQMFVRKFGVRGKKNLYKF